ncbi:hypothetical protein ACIGHG_03285 [Bacillus sp. NPDC077411]|uniref:Uncharacterized protein n=1 Tax=Bacillus bruguierae TaxID=3127667 RepID=A0ABU8FGA5_9BACI
MLINRVKEVISERMSIHPNYSFGIEHCWNKLINLLSEDTQKTIEVLKELDEEQVLYVSEVFEDIAYKLQSQDYINELEKLEKKFPNLNLASFVETAKDFMN